MNEIYFLIHHRRRISTSQNYKWDEPSVVISCSTLLFFYRNIRFQYVTRLDIIQQLRISTNDFFELPKMIPNNRRIKIKILLLRKIYLF